MTQTTNFQLDKILEFAKRFYFDSIPLEDVLVVKTDTDPEITQNYSGWIFVSGDNHLFMMVDGWRARLEFPVSYRIMDTTPKMFLVSYGYFNVNHRVGAPAIILHDPNGNIKREMFYLNGDHFKPEAYWMVPEIVEYKLKGITNM